jgi:hypothetical protein
MVRTAEGTDPDAAIRAQQTIVRSGAATPASESGRILAECMPHSR